MRARRAGPATHLPRGRAPRARAHADAAPPGLPPPPFAAATRAPAPAPPSITAVPRHRPAYQRRGSLSRGPAPQRGRGAGVLGASVAAGAMAEGRGP